MSSINVTNIKSRQGSAPTFPQGLNVSAGVATFAGNVSIAGTLTYEDVTNVDSVGVVTARLGVIATAGRGIQVTAGGLNVTAGVATFSNEVTAAGGVDVSGGLKVAGITTFQSLMEPFDFWLYGD